LTGQNACLTLEMRVTLEGHLARQRESIKYIGHIEHVYSDVLVECKWVAGNICEHFFTASVLKYRYKTRLISTSKSRSPRSEGVIFNDYPPIIYSPR